ncbi:unnamed protein product [Amaranthus hypochondriacus]
MGRRGRPPKVQVGARKPVSPSGSSREPSSSPERYLFYASAGASGSHIGSKGLDASSSTPAVGLSWVSVLKASAKSPGAAGSSIPLATAAGQQVPPVSAAAPISGNPPSSSRKIAKKRVVEDHQPGPSERSLNLGGESLSEVVVNDSNAGMATRDSNLAVLVHEGVSRTNALPCPPAPISNSFAVLGHMPSTLESQMEINWYGQGQQERALARAQVDLQSIQDQLHLNPGREDLVMREREAASSLYKLKLEMDSALCQKAKLQWIQYGDDNTQPLTALVLCGLMHIAGSGADLASFEIVIKVLHCVFSQSGCHTAGCYCICIGCVDLLGLFLLDAMRYVLCLYCLACIVECIMMLCCTMLGSSLLLVLNIGLLVSFSVACWVAFSELVYC